MCVCRRVAEAGKHPPRRFISQAAQAVIARKAERAAEEEAAGRRVALAKATDTEKAAALLAAEAAAKNVESVEQEAARKCHAAWQVMLGRSIFLATFLLGSPLSTS